MSVDRQLCGARHPSSARTPLTGKGRASFLKAVEHGRRQQNPRLPILLQLAEALRVRDLSELTGDQSIPVRMVTGSGHPALSAVREAVNAVPIQPSGTVQPLATLRARLDAAWRTRHASPNHRTALGDLLPDLIRDVQLAATMCQGERRREAQALLAETYGLTQMFLAYQAAPQADRDMGDHGSLITHPWADERAGSCRGARGGRRVHWSAVLA